MRRLTFDGLFCDIAQCREMRCPYDGSCSQREVWERLKQYEDSGLEPEQVVRCKEIVGGAFADNISRNMVLCEWISVRDRLPKLPDRNYCSVYVIARGENFVLPMHYERVLKRGQRVERWCWAWGRIYDEPQSITHWMPLPPGNGSC